MIDLTVTHDKPNYEGLFFWEYVVTNDMGDSTSGTQYKTCDFKLTGVPYGAPDDQENTPEWFEGWYPEGPYGYSVEYWWYGEGAEGEDEQSQPLTDWLLSDESATFSFTTPPVLLAEGMAHVFYWNYEDKTTPIKVPGHAPTISVNIASPLIPVNANNDNHDPMNDAQPVWKLDKPYIPFIRDFDATNLWQDDPQLRPMTISVSPGPAGALTIESFSNGANALGVVRFWEDARKSNAWSCTSLEESNQPRSVTIYIEGAHESWRTDDIRVEMKFELYSMPLEVAATGFLTVTPVIGNFIKSIASPSMTFVEGSGLKGIQAKNPNAPAGFRDGISFVADVMTSPEENVKYLQVITDIQNGANGNPVGMSRYGGGHLFDETWGAGGSLPMLDAPRDNTAGDPTVPTSVSASNIPNVSYYGMLDSPAHIWGQTPAQQVAAASIDYIDTKTIFRTHLIVKYDDGSIYSIAYWNWNANFYATSDGPGTGLKNIMPASGVFADPDWTRSNQDPLKTSGPVAQESLQWIEVT